MVAPCRPFAVLQVATVTLTHAPAQPGSDHVCEAPGVSTLRAGGFGFAGQRWDIGTALLSKCLLNE